jgi:hypothetical protein
MGLREKDLRSMVYDIFEIDSFASKMGEDKDIVTVSFSVKDQLAAKDLESFIEKGYAWVLDADSTEGEQADGTYKVFVELARDNQARDNIMELADGVQKLGDIENLKFRYYKNWKSKDLSSEALEEMLPIDPENYGIKVDESNLQNYKNFFNRSFVENIDMWDDVLRISKKYADPLHFRFVDVGPTQQTLDAIKESFNANDFAEIIFLSKYIGDYNITKYGNKLTFENAGTTVVLERIT